MIEFREVMFLFIIPGIIGNVAHMVIVKKDVLSFLARPISSEWFGENKTYRGFAFLPVFVGIICLLESIFFGPFNSGHSRDFFIGAGLGLSYMLAELPNSFVKRRLGIAPGKTSGKFRFLQLIVDKTDSLTGACIFYYFAMKTSISEIVLLFMVSFLLLLGISYVLVITNLKKSL
jgi:hypothetical protein